eukprot:15346343-Ditylum_brightwellii.AAC.1
MRHKTRFVAGGNVVDSSMYPTASTTVQDLSVTQLILVSVKNRLGIMVGNIGNAFPAVPCALKKHCMEWLQQQGHFVTFWEIFQEG